MTPGDLALSLRYNFGYTGRVDEVKHKARSQQSHSTPMSIGGRTKPAINVKTYMNRGARRMREICTSGGNAKQPQSYRNPPVS